MTSTGLAAGAAAAAVAGFTAAAAGFAAAAPLSASAAGFLLNQPEMPPLSGLGSSFFLNMARTLALPVEESTMKSAKMTPGFGFGLVEVVGRGCKDEEERRDEREKKI